MVMFAVFCVALVFERIRARRAALLLCALLFPLILFAAYNTQSYLAERIDQAVNDVRIFEENPNTSLGLRVVYWVTSFFVILF